MKRALDEDLSTVPSSAAHSDAAVQPGAAVALAADRNHLKRAREEDSSAAAHPAAPAQPGGAIAVAADPHDWAPLLRNLPSAPAEHIFRLVTYNVNGVRNRINNGRPEAGFVLALRSMRPSVLALQEVKMARADASQALLKFSAVTVAQPKLTARHLNLPDAFKAQPGVATLLGPGVEVARAERDLPTRFRSEAGGEDSLFRVLTLWLPRERVVLVNVYAPNSGDDGKNAERRARWDTAFRGFLGSLTRGESLAWPQRQPPSLFGAKPLTIEQTAQAGAAAQLQPTDASTYAGRVVVAGDLNVLPTDEDYQRPTGSRVAGASGAERAAHARLLADCGLRDVWRALHPGLPGYSFVNSNWRGRGVLAARFDGVLVSEALLGAVERIWVADHAPRGDHLPLCVDFDFARCAAVER